MTIDTNIVYSDKDVNKNLYRKKTYYTCCWTRGISKR